MSQTTLPPIETLYEEAMQKVKKHREWYRGKAAGRRLSSKTFRALAIIFVGLGSLCPLLDATQVLEGSAINLSRWGYVAFGIAAIFVGFDRFFGVSSGWIRYIKAMLKIDKLTHQFEFEWNAKLTDFGTSNLSKEQRIEMIKFLQGFVNAVAEIVEVETQNWAAEFETSLTELVKAAGNGKG